MSKKIVVFGAGSFGTALAYKLSLNNHKVVILARNKKVIEGINQQRKNPVYLTNATYKFNEHVSCTNNADEALLNADFIVHTIPVQSTTEYLKRLKDKIPKTLPIISASKGIHSTTLKYMNDIVPEALQNPEQPFAVLSGPTFAKELVENQPSAAVVASFDEDLRLAVQHLFHHRYFRVYTSPDLIAVEVGGALKNVYAIAAGISDGLGFGLNTIAGMVTRGINEMTKLAVALGAQPATLSGLSGIGDLMLTCYGALSRNRTVGLRLGRGETMQQIRATSLEVAEGVATTPAAAQLAKQLDLDCPIIFAVNRALQGEDPRKLVAELLAREIGEELPDYTPTQEN